MAGKRRRVAAAVACLLTLNGCESSSNPGSSLQSASEIAQRPGPAGAPDRATSDDVSPKSDPAAAVAPHRQGADDQAEDRKLGKQHFRAARYELAERHFRRAVELRPDDLEAWIGLAASYDRLRRFDLADRAYDRAQKIAGPRAEILNNRGYSYMLRGEPRRAREILLQAQAQDPASPYIENNLALLELSARMGRADRQPF
jgi:Flp pilus assembly protein TadD